MKRLLISAAATLLVVALPVPHILKAGLFAPIWYFCLRPFTRIELLGYLLININMVLMDRMTIEKGTFWFTRPDFLGLPAWEFGIWGFYGLMAHRLSASARFRLPSVAFALGFGASFQLIANQDVLFAVATLLTVLMVFYFGMSAARVGLAALLFGIPFEWIGAWTGQWRYTEPAPYLLAPLWGLPMWGGSLILFSHFLFPLLKSDLLSRYISPAKADHPDPRSS